jgi:preprotein translocase subunit SecD
MNRYPLWRYILIGVLLVVAFLYTLPNFFGEEPAVQVSPVRTTEQADTALLERMEGLLREANVAYGGV